MTSMEIAQNQILVGALIWGVKVLCAILVTLGAAFIAVLAWVGRGLITSIRAMSSTINVHSEEITQLKTVIKACPGCPDVSIDNYHNSPTE